MRHLLLLAILITGCASSTEVHLGEVFQVQSGKSVEIDGAKVTFIGVGQDSRCPPNVQCVWAGDAEVNIRVNGVDAALHTHGGSQYPQSQVVAGYTVTLRELTIERPFVASMVVDRAP